MSPVPSVTREQFGVRTVPVLPYRPLEVVVGPVKEIVVDWQLPTDSERKS